MRILRSSCYVAPNQPPIMGVVRDCDTVDTLDSHALQLIDAMEGQGLVFNDIFYLGPGTTIEYATFRAGQRMREFAEQERAQVLLYFWVVDQWRPLRPGGVIASDEPAPLSASQIRPVLEQLAKRPDYQNYTYIIPSSDGRLVILRNGKVSDQPIP